MPALVHLLLFHASESPKHLYINKNKKLEAQEALARLRDVSFDETSQEMEQLEAEKRFIEGQVRVEWIEFYRQKPLRKALIVALGVHVCQQFSGK